MNELPHPDALLITNRIEAALAPINETVSKLTTAVRHLAEKSKIQQHEIDQAVGDLALVQCVIEEIQLKTKKKEHNRCQFTA